MTRSEMQQKVVGVLRQCALSGSDREIALDQPLGEQGLGLDSLSLVEFVAAIEKTFNIELPDSIWTDRGRLTPNDFIDLIGERDPKFSTHVPRQVITMRNSEAPNASYWSRVLSAFKERGSIQSVLWILSRVYRRMQDLIYVRETHIILIRDLVKDMPRESFAGSDLTFRELEVSDRLSLTNLWPPHLQSAMLRKFDKRQQSGFICLAACNGEEVVAVDYLCPSEDFDPDTGLTIRTKPGTCYALDLYEKYQGKGIGMALLAHSLSVSHKRGFERQVTFVRAKNVKMLGAAVQLLGFVKIGQIETRRVFRHATSVLHMEGRSSSDRTIHF